VYEITPCAVNGGAVIVKKTSCVNILILLFLIPSLFLTFSCSLFESDEEKAERHYQAGMQAIEEKKTDAAVIHFRNAVQKNPYHAEAHYRLGTLYIRSKQPHLAEGEF
jgi:cytochrome c-type biogenesis protein CcmH/NrfG